MKNVLQMSETSRLRRQGPHSGRSPPACVWGSRWPSSSAPPFPAQPAHASSHPHPQGGWQGAHPTAVGIWLDLPLPTGFTTSHVMAGALPNPGCRPAGPKHLHPCLPLLPTPPAPPEAFAGGMGCQRGGGGSLGAEVGSAPLWWRFSLGHRGSFLLWSADFWQVYFAGVLRAPTKCCAGETDLSSLVSGRGRGARLSLGLKRGPWGSWVL